MSTSSHFLATPARRRIAVNTIFINFSDMKDNGLNEEEMMHVTAHEIAHFELKHNHQRAKNHEEKAEEQAIVWGFRPRITLKQKIMNIFKSLNPARIRETELMPNIKYINEPAQSQSDEKGLHSCSIITPSGRIERKRRNKP